MKVTIVNTLSLLLLSVLVSTCFTRSPKAFPKFFNTDEFVGFVSMSSDCDTVALKYELDGVDGNPVLFKNCDDVKQTLETDIVTHQFHLWRLMQINCKAITMFQNASSSTQSYWASDFNHTFIADLPATAIPDLGGNSLDGRKGLLKDVEPILKTRNINAYSVLAILCDTMEINYVLMARGDFNHDGIEDILLRLDWYITSAFGKGFSLLMLSKSSFSAESNIVWRDG